MTIRFGFQTPEAQSRTLASLLWSAGAQLPLFQLLREGQCEKAAARLPHIYLDKLRTESSLLWNAGARLPLSQLLREGQCEKRQPGCRTYISTS